MKKVALRLFNSSSITTILNIKKVFNINRQGLILDIIILVIYKLYKSRLTKVRLPKNKKTIIW